MSEQQPVMEEETPEPVVSAETAEAAPDPEVVAHSADESEELPWCVYNSSA